MVRVREPRSRPEPPLPLRQGWRVALRNRPFVRLVAAFFLNGIANGLPATLFLLFVANVLETPARCGSAAAALFRRGGGRGTALAQDQLPARQAPRLGRLHAVGLRGVRLGAAAGAWRFLAVRPDLLPVRPVARRRSGAAGIDPGRCGRPRPAGERPAPHRAVLRHLEHGLQALPGAGGGDRLSRARPDRLRGRWRRTRHRPCSGSPPSMGCSPSRSSSPPPPWCGISRSAPPARTPSADA